MVYIYSPVNAVTGGVELLQQLGYKINCFGRNAKIVYAPTGFKNSMTYTKYVIPEVYNKYGLECVYDIEDSVSNSVVVPETLAWKLPDIKHAKKYLWWLSVDFYTYANSKFFTKMKMIGKSIDFASPDIIHLVQSYYAAEWLKQKGVDSDKILVLSDYLRSNFIEQSVSEINKFKKQQFLYNPRKGLEFTKKIIEQSAFEAIPLEGYTPDEMVSVLQESMLYIDFGNHPGKDRIPREAAISGCCIITGKRGAAANDYDIPIDRNFKFEDCDGAIKDIVLCIDSIMNNYTECRKKFDAYREKIRNEESLFDNQVKNIFIR